MNDITAFTGACAYRTWLNNVIPIRGWTVATNGHVLVAQLAIDTPEDAVLEAAKHVPENVDLVGMVRSAHASSQSQGIDWVDCAAIAKDLRQCHACDGRGHSFVADCADCDGEGEFDRGMHAYTCKNCEGKGVLDSDEESGRKQRCSSCCGAGRGSQRAYADGIGDARHGVSTGYIALLCREFPDAQVARLPEPEKTFFYMRSPSTGVVGILMSMRRAA